MSNVLLSATSMKTSMQSCTHNKQNDIAAVPAAFAFQPLGFRVSHESHDVGFVRYDGFSRTEAAHVFLFDLFSDVWGKG